MDEEVNSVTRGTCLLLIAMLAMFAIGCPAEQSPPWVAAEPSLDDQIEAVRAGTSEEIKSHAVATDDDMARIAADIRKALKQSEATELAKLSERLDDRALAFEVSHPRLTAVVASITDLLASIGI